MEKPSVISGIQSIKEIQINKKKTAPYIQVIYKIEGPQPQSGILGIID
jgi:hypothetical protein